MKKLRGRQFSQIRQIVQFRIRQSLRCQKDIKRFSFRLFLQEKLKLPELNGELNLQDKINHIIKMDEIQLRQFIKQELQNLLGGDKFIFQKNLHILDKDIQLGKDVGTKIGTEAAQKIAFHGATPVIQADFITSPDTSGAQLKTAVDAIRTVLINKGFTASA